MELRSRNLRPFNQSQPIVPCAQCGDELFAPDWSEYLDECRIRHLWVCESCGYQFETLVRYPAAGAAASARARVARLI
jgi:ribosomal protein L37AE/L43A